MADVSKINGYDLKDAVARQELEGKQDELISGLNIKTINGESILGGGDITIEGATNENTNKIVDLVMFMGQSNMAGRGVQTTGYPQTAPVVPEGQGYEFKAISDPTKLYNLVEPFGKDENNTDSGVSEASKTGSMVSAFANAYYEFTKTPIVGVSCSKGGSIIDFWKPGSPALNDAINRHNVAKTWLNNNGYTIRHDFMVWCQGEGDAKQLTPEATYCDVTNSMVEAMMEHGVEKCFFVRIGHYIESGQPDPHTAMIKIQTNFCKTYENIVLVSTDFAGLTDYLKDEQHYVQEGYNIVGKNAGTHTAFFINNGVEPAMYDPEYDNMYFPYNVEAEGNIVLDEELSETSENAVQNKAITTMLRDLMEQIELLDGAVKESTDKLEEFDIRLSTLESDSGVEMVNVTYNLTGVESSNTRTKVGKGSEYSTVLSVSDILGELSNVTVSVDGVDVTSETVVDDVVNIENVTGDVIITANAAAIETIFKMDFREKSLDEYVSEGLVSTSGNISSFHSIDGDKLSIEATAKLMISNTLTFPTNCEILLRLKTDTDFSNEDPSNNLGGGIALFNNNGARPMIMLRNPYTDSSYTSGMGLQSRLVSSGGDTITLTEPTIPTKDNVFHDVIIHYEGDKVWWSIDGEKSTTVTNTRNSNTVNQMLGYNNTGAAIYNANNVTFAVIAVREL